MGNRKGQPYTDEEIDFLTEMMNIGSGNAGTVFSQLLQCKVDMRIPKLYIISATEDVSSIFRDESRRFSCVKMSMIGDIRGNISFIVAEKQSEELIHIAKKAMLGPEEFLEERDFGSSVLSEIGNILARVYLAAIYNFCRLSIFHTIPGFSVIASSALLEGIFKERSNSLVVLIENEFVIEKENITSYMFINTSDCYIEKLKSSIKEAKRMYGDTGLEKK
jgi:chemotaxis protein CheC